LLRLNGDAEEGYAKRKDQPRPEASESVIETPGSFCHGKQVIRWAAGDSSLS